jgi:hypothetical protein
MEAHGNNGAVLLRYRGREIRASDVAQIRACVEEFGERGRTEVAHRLSEAWGWRQPNGELKSFACRDLLLRLEQRGAIDLPKRRSAGLGHRRRSLAEHPLPVYPWPLDGGDLATLVVRVITAEERLGWRILVDRFHDLGEAPVVGEHLLYAAYLEGQVVALLGWGSAAMHCVARDRHIGWDTATRRQRLHLVANNVRFLILPWVRVKHLASKILATNLRCLSGDWQHVWGHEVVLAETFVDPSRFAGTCYRASNWHPVGSTGGKAKRGNNYLRHGHRKEVYLYPLHRHWRRQLTTSAPAQPPPR